MATAIEVTHSYLDQAGKRATSTSYIANGLTIVQVVEGLQAAAGVIDGVIDIVQTGVEFTIDVDISALTGNTTAGVADVEEVGEFVFNTVDGRKTQVNVPGIINLLSGAGTDDIDQSGLDVAAFISMMEDGITVTGGTVIPSDVNEDDISAIAHARERVRNSGSR